MSWEMMAPQKPLFFRSCFNDCAFLGIVYDPCLLRWGNFDFPRLEKGIWCTSSSCGLIGSYEAVICDGVLYYFMSHPDLTTPHLMALDLMKPPSSIQSLLQEFIPVPYPLICAGLINLSNKLVMVGKKDYWPHEGVVILELEDKTWREVAQMPISMYKKLRCNYLICCCGTDDFLFMHSSMWQSLLTFDMRQKVWKWLSHHYLEQLHFCNESESLFYCVFCFEPRLDISS
ncbi:F-box/kelch-repeat protein At3g61590-like [Zingiber officinale]|uniref:F-box/kelch-repeat protein At3g61590-like n=1 Tax=Zingiber officinale TaxID=94328 RepID=UPI001C4C484E|nr:F-box/kelch-repeat protein At3g61590-like [Zingiber officinale]